MRGMTTVLVLIVGAFSVFSLGFVVGLVFDCWNDLDIRKVEDMGVAGSIAKGESSP
jgi:hypothetical protein